MSFVHPSSLIFPQEKGRHTKSRTKFLLEAYSKRKEIRNLHLKVDSEHNFCVPTPTNITKWSCTN